MKELLTREVSMTYRQYDDSKMFTCYMGKINMQEIQVCFALSA